MSYFNISSVSPVCISYNTKVQFSCLNDFWNQTVLYASETLELHHQSTNNLDESGKKSTTCLWDLPNPLNTFQYISQAHL